MIFFDKCHTCEYFKECLWVEKTYIDIRWDSEFMENEFIENNITLNEIEFWLNKLKESFNNNWIWISSENFSLYHLHYKHSFIHKQILWYKITDVALINWKIVGLKLNNDEFEDFVIFKFKIGGFDIEKWNNKYIKIYYLIYKILYKHIK